MEYRNVKNSMKAIIKLIAFLLILFICFEIIYSITKRKDSYQKMADFLEQEENFDVLFFGSSRTYNSMFPMQLWNDYGIVSYNLGNPNETIVGSYYNMLLALEQTNPKLVVIDAFFCYLEEKINEEKLLHTSFDAYPLSYTKYLVIKDLFSEENIIDKSFEYLFDFSIYHSRWAEIDKNDFKITKQYEKGAKSEINVINLSRENSLNSIDMYNKPENINMQYLRKIIEHCIKNEIEILVTFLPAESSEFLIPISEYVKKICDEYNINYINFLNMDIENENTDYFDEELHLNPSGARKINNYIGKYISEHYDIKNQKNNEIYNFWYEDYDEYIDYKISLLKDNEINLNNYLMLLYGEEDIKYEIKISSKREITEGSTLDNLLENIENNYKIDDDTFENNPDKTIKITTWDNRNGNRIGIVWW